MTNRKAPAVPLSRVLHKTPSWLLRWVAGAMCMVAALPVGSAETASVAPSLLAQLVYAISTYSEGRGRVACSDPVMARHFQRAGLKVDAASPVAWACTREEAETLARARKLVICDNADWAKTGASIIVGQEGGRPVYYLYSAAAKGTGIYVGAAVWKFAKELR